MAYLYEACDQISDSCHPYLLRKMRRKMCIYKCMLNVYKNQQNRQTGSRNLMGSKTLPTIWHTYMKFVIKYQISANNSDWEKCDKKYLGQTEGRTEVKQYTPSPFGGWGYNKLFISWEITPCIWYGLTFLVRCHSGLCRNSKVFVVTNVLCEQVVPSHYILKNKI